MKRRKAWLRILAWCVLVLLPDRSGDRASGQSAPPAPHIQVHAARAGTIKSLAFAADDRTLVVTEEFSPPVLYIGMGQSQNVSLWDVETGSELRSLADQSEVSDAESLHQSAVTSDGKLLITATGALNFWDLTTGRNLGSIKLLDSYNSERGSIRAAGPVEEALRGWDSAPEIPRHDRLFNVGAPGITLVSNDKRFILDGGGLLLLQWNQKRFERLRLGHIPPGSPELAAPDSAERRLKYGNMPAEAIKSGWYRKYLPEAAAISPDSKYVAVGFLDGAVQIADFVSRPSIRTLQSPNRAIISLAFSPDSSVLAAVAMPFRCVGSAESDRFNTEADCRDTGEVILLDPRTGKGMAGLPVASGPIYHIAFTPDGKLATGTPDGIRLWDLSGHSGRIYQGDVKLLRASWAIQFAFSHDGRYAAVREAGKDVTVIDGKTGQVLRSLHHKIGSSRVGSAAVLRSRSWLSVRGPSLEEIGNSRVVRRVNGIVSQTELLSEDATSLAVRSGPRLEIWDLASAKRRCAAPFAAGEARFAMNRSGDLLAGAGQPLSGAIKVWNANNCELLDTITPVKTPMPPSLTVNSPSLSTKYPTFAEVIMAIALSPDGKRLAYANNANETVTWDLTNRRELARWRVPVPTLYSKSDLPPEKREILLFIPTGQTGVPHIPTQSVSKVRDTPKDLFRYEQDLYSVDSITFSPDGKAVATLDRNQQTRLWNAETGEFLSTLGTPVLFAHTGENTAGYGSGNLPGRGTFTFSPDGQYGLVSFDLDSKAHLWDLRSNREPRVLSCYGAGFQSLRFSADGRYITSDSAADRACLWDAKTGQHLATMLSFGDGSDWLVYTPEGLFDGSPRAFAEVTWRFSDAPYDVAPVEIFMREFYRPGLIREILSGRAPQAPRQLATLDRRQPEIQILTSDSKPIVSGTLSQQRQVSLRVVATEAPPQPGQPSGSGIYDIRLSRNGSLIRLQPGDLLKGKGNRVVATFTVPLLAGENHFTAYAFNRDNVKSRDASVTIEGGSKLSRQGTAYVVSVGINHYANSQFDLKYAVADASVVVEELKRRQEATGRFARVVSVSLTDSEATRDTILEVLRRLNGVPPYARAFPKALDALQGLQPEDALFIYFAGHGFARDDRFYLVPHDLGYTGTRSLLAGDQQAISQIASHSVSDADLASLITELDCSQFVLIIDACNSGQALESDEQRQGPFNSRGLAQLAYDKGMYILTAAQGYQAALETARLGHGYLTYSLIEEGIRQAKADRDPQDGKISIREWFDYAVERVPELQGEFAGERLLVQRPSAGAAEKDAALANAVQRQLPRAFYRRETEADPPVIAVIR